MADNDTKTKEFEMRCDQLFSLMQIFLQVEDDPKGVLMSYDLESMIADVAAQLPPQVVDEVKDLAIKAVEKQQ